MFLSARLFARLYMKTDFCIARSMDSLQKIFIYIPEFFSQSFATIADLLCENSIAYCT